jgi:ketosteroid isomerase-like protein
VGRAQVEAARELFRLFNTQRYEALIAHVSQDLVYAMREDEPDAQVLHGLDRYAALIATWTQMFDGLHVVPDEYIDAGEWVIAPSRLVGRGRTSGVDVDEPYVFAYRFDGDGILHEGREYRTVDEACAALGAEAIERHPA